MNILIIAKEDFSGAGYALMQAINTYTEHDCRAVSYRRLGLRYPLDMLRPNADDLLYWVKWADVLNLHDGPPPVFRGLRDKPSRPVVTTYHGSWYRARHKRIGETRGVVQTALTIDLATYGPRWIGRAMPDLSYLYDPDPNTFIACQAAVHRKGVKGVDEAERALKGLENVRYEFITKMVNVKCLRRKAKARLTIDTGPAPDMFAYGTTSLESWSMGMPVISCPQQWIHDAVLEYVGYSPYYRCQGEEDFREIVCRFRDDDVFYDYWRDVGIQYVREFHAPGVVAEKFIAACEEVL